jgi:hypothetical protein
MPRHFSALVGISRSSISGERTWMLIISGIWPRRSTPRELGR